ncbi:HNH endonuclease [Labrenzia sp. R4_1]|uniref:HNH endonuclease n=1 Tax=Labrenzia sp. R4_1 TaxID=2821106 RepID=UPI001ADAC0C3|nr:HNH endonuclease [Labrenzia sp. R4_1]MBO9423199.1 HNH endonuclease [Labrenzia sp. R4_1]
MIENPQSFVVRQECEKAAYQNGYRRPLEERDGWRGFASTTVPGAIHMAATGANGAWFLALEHTGVIAELGLSAERIEGPGNARFRFESIRELYAVLPRVYQLASSLPDMPLRTFEEKTRDLPRATEAERLIVQRVGQDVFRAGLVDYWQGRCPLTGISDTALLRASHIIPWSECETDADRLDVHNGLLLSALWDAAFDQGLVTFDERGQPEFSPNLSNTARAALTWSSPISLTDQHRKRLEWHRQSLFQAG